MKCGEVRKFLPLYLDSELDAKYTLEVEQHLGLCAECAGLFEAETKCEARLSKFLRQGEASSALWRRIESQIGPARTPGLRMLWPVALAALLILAAGAAFMFETRSLDLANAVEECHDAYVFQLTAPEFTGAVPPKIAQQFDGRIDAAAFAYRPTQATFSSNGARLCHVQGIPVALILGRSGPTPISMIVLQRSELDHFPGTKKRLESGDPIVCGRAGRYQFAARFVGSHVVCLVGDVPRPMLEGLLQTVARSDG